MVSPKKHLGQHFLTDLNIAANIVEQLSRQPDPRPVIEVGPGTGVLTQFLLQRPDVDLTVVDIDRESIEYLKEHFPQLQDRIVGADFLRTDLTTLVRGRFDLIGNFPYNISSQIFFKVLEHRQAVGEVVCMIQKEVADRLAAPPGSKTYGILSVLLQAYYNISYCFTVKPHVFHPPPKVNSGVIRLVRNEVMELPCSPQLFFRVVKQAFNTRRKTLRNALKPLGLSPELTAAPVFNQRAEQLSVAEFISLTQQIEADRPAPHAD